jgi:hypothetical protein
MLLTIRISLLFHALMLLHLALFVRVPGEAARRGRPARRR